MYKKDPLLEMSPSPHSPHSIIPTFISPNSILLDIGCNTCYLNGEIITSIPNVARLEVRLQLLLGKFNYTYGEILSKDHLRFFTKDTSIRPFNYCG